MPKKSFWRRPEGVTGILGITALIGGGAWLLYKAAPTLLALADNSLYAGALLLALTGVVYVALDPKSRNLIWYAYKSIMRQITGWFVVIDPIGILKSHIEHLEDNLRKMSKQIGLLRGQMRQLKSTMDSNSAEMAKNMRQAEQAQKQGDERNLTLATRKAARLQEANAKYGVLFQKMETLYQLLTRMYENSEIMLEDTRDQVNIKEQEYLAIKAGNNAIKSAMNILSGNPDQTALFEQATEALADDVSAKVGEMERFMDTTRNLMATIDLQNGVFEDEGLRILQQWGAAGPLSSSNDSAKKSDQTLDINQKPKQPVKEPLANDNAYHDLFE